MAVITPVTPHIRPTTRDHIATTLQAEIITGRYQPGQRLVERELAERFNVSSIPIREALQVLETQGLVAKQPNRGCSVVDLSPVEIEQICELREVLEPRVAEWAACRMDSAGAARLTAQAMKLREAAERQDLSSFYAADIDFHRIFWDLSGNDYAARMLESVVGALFASGLRTSSGIDLALEYEKHERLLRALVEGRPSDAALLLGNIAGGFRGKLRNQPAPRDAATRDATASPTGNNGNE
jgi:DNA-binding GntR family transcriptional regulator